MASPAVASVAPLLVKDVPRILPVNMSSMEQGWLLYRCDRAEAISHGEYRDEPCSSVPMGKVQRGYDLRQTALGWQRQTIVGWRLAAQLDVPDLRVWQVRSLEPLAGAGGGATALLMEA